MGAVLKRFGRRFYLLSPATSYAGEYTWNGDARSGCEKILTDVGIAKEEWQMGVTKAFIKNPETVSSVGVVVDSHSHDARSSSHSKPCETDTGITWPRASNVPGATISGTRTKLLRASSGSGRTTRRASRMLRRGSTGTRSLLAGRSVVASVY